VADEPQAVSPDQSEEHARKAVRRGLEAYATNRIARYERTRLAELLRKDLLMIALRGVQSADELLAELFAAFESSSEETHMGNAIQLIATELARSAIDLGDLLVDEPDGDLWVVEVKSQTNTVNSRSRPQILRILKRRVGEYGRYQPARPRTVRAMIGVLRGTSRDVMMNYRAVNHADRDIDGFEYRYLVGKAFWEWLTLRPGIYSLVGDISDLSVRIAVARSLCLDRMRTQMHDWLDLHDRPHDIPSVLRLVEEGKWPRAPRVRKPKAS